MISIHRSYLEEVKRKKRDGDSSQILKVPCKQRGRPLLFGALDSKVQLYLKKVREGGGGVSSRIAIAAAKGILSRYDPTKLAENGGHIQLNKHWAHSLLKRMNFVQRKATTAKSKEQPYDFQEKKKEFLSSVFETVVMEDIPHELILNWNQTGLKLVPSSTWTMERQGSKCVEMIGVNDKRQITAVFCGSLIGEFLPLQLIYKGKTARCLPRFTFPAEWDITCSPKHWSTEKTMFQYFHILKVFVRE